MTREEAINEIKSWDFLEGKEIEAIHTLIPELKESEDERIRKEIVSALKFANDGGVYDKHIAYLEKLKEQNQKITVKIPKFRVGDIIQHVPLESWDSSRRINAIDKDGYYTDLSHLGDNVSGGFIGFYFEDEYELVEQKPVEWKPQPESLEALMYAIEGKWDMISPTSYLSRRLEDLYEGLVNTYNVDESLLDELPKAASRTNTAEDIEELKELKKKIDASMDEKPAEWSDTNELVFQDICKHLKEEGYSGWVVLLNAIRNGEFQPKQEWSEEDDWKRKELIQYLEEKGDYRTVWMTWLKSLRPSWKPSEEQN